ncbi:MAG: hypothetical protein Tsb0010_13540 [Parvularculaceae bacterium]
MEVILLERVEKLGQMGDIVNVKPGFARNFLLPKGKALRATDANKAHFESQRAELEARNLERRSEAEKVAEKLDGQSFVLIRQAGDSGQLYGSASSRDIAEAASAAGFSVARSQIVLDRPLKELGLHEVRIILHPEVSVAVTVNIARTEDEAERQARGEDVTQRRDEDEEETIEAEEVFESETLAREAAEKLADSSAEEESDSAEPAPSSADDAGEEKQD